MTKSVPSLLCPPGAPKKKKVVTIYDLDKIPKLELPGKDEPPTFNYAAWRRTINFQMVRDQFFAVLPEDVATETNSDILKYWRNLYSPQSQPQTDDEHFYVDFMIETITAREAEMVKNPHSPDACKTCFITLI